MSQDIDVNAFAENLNEKLDRDLKNSAFNMDLVIAYKAPTQDDPTWYRQYKSGWLEQGGSFPAPGDSGSNPYTLNFPKAFVDTSYYINMAYTNNTTHCAYYDINIRSKTIRSAIITTHCSGTWYAATVVWEAKGYAANPAQAGDDESTYGNVYKTYYYRNTDLDYANAVGPYYPSQMASYAIPGSGVIMGWLNPGNNDDGRIMVNGKVVWGGTYYITSVYIPVKKNDVFSYSGIDNPTTSGELYFVPYLEPSQSTDPSVTTLVDAIWPVGSIYIGTTVNCPLASIIGTWEKIDGDLVLQSSSQAHQANTTIEAGLPNITYSNGGYTSDPTIDGALSQGSRYDIFQSETTRSGRFIAQYSFDASRCSSVYGNSDTVQPPAYVVNVWRRTA